jgi:hypothetical protein
MYRLQNNFLCCPSSLRWNLVVVYIMLFKTQYNAPAYGAGLRDLILTIVALAPLNPSLVMHRKCLTSWEGGHAIHHNAGIKMACYETGNCLRRCTYVERLYSIIYLRGSCFALFHLLLGIGFDLQSITWWFPCLSSCHCNQFHGAHYKL